MSTRRSPCALARPPLTRLAIVGSAILMLLAAAPTAAQVALPPEDDAQVEQPAADDPPLVLPPTVVEGRPDPFPTAPLDADAVITPTRGEAFGAQVGSSFSVVSREDIERSQQATVAEVLRTVVGLDVVRQGGPGGLSSVFLRGANSQHTKVLVDGMPVNDPSNATRLFDFSTLTVDNIERIEVLRGPQSVLYGSDAMGGVVHIITRRGEGPSSIEFSGEGGALGTGRATLTSSGGGTRAYYSVSGSFLHTDGISHAAERLGNTERDSYENTTFSGRVGWTPSDSANVDYVFRYSDVRAEIDDFDFFSGLPVDNPLRANLSEVFSNRVQLSSRMLEGDVEQIVAFSLVDYDRRDTDPGPFEPAQFLGQTRMVDWQTNLVLTPSNIFTVGASYQHEEASTSFEPQAAQNLASVFIQDQIQLFDRWFTTVGVRWDDHSRAGRAQTYRVTSIYHFPRTATAIHGSLGTGFRAPSLAENLFAFGNPDLRPEESRGWDLGLRQRLLDERVSLDATYFRNDFENLIQFDFDTFALENVGRARSSGVELTGSWLATQRTTLAANYTFTDTLSRETGEQLLRRPRHKASVSAVQQLGAATLHGSLLFVGPRLDLRDFVLREYFLLNLTGRLPVSPRWTLFGRLENILDQQYEEVRGFGTPGITGYAGASAVW